MRARAASSMSTPASPSRTREPQCTCSHPETLNTAGAKQGPAVQVGQGGQPAGQAGAPAPQEPRRVRGDNLLHITHFFIQLKFQKTKLFQLLPDIVETDKPMDSWWEMVEPPIITLTGTF